MEKWLKQDRDYLQQILISRGVEVDVETLDRFLGVLTYIGIGNNVAEELRLYKELSPAPEDGLVVVVPRLPVSSFCRHHILPWVGWVSVEYHPGKWILGLSKFQRVVDFYSRGLTLQEEFTKNVHTLLRVTLETTVKVEVKAMHTCAVARGVKASPDFEFVTRIEE